jgi:hypothetical protein
VQCTLVNFSLLTTALRDYARDSPIDLVYVNNTAILHLEDSVFKVILKMLFTEFIMKFRNRHFTPRGQRIQGDFKNVVHRIHHKI